MGSATQDTKGQNVLTRGSRSFDRAHTQIDAVAVPGILVRDPDAFGGRRLGACRAGTLSLSDDGHLSLTATEATPRYILMPRLTEAHVHLDKCHTIARLHGVGGDLTQALTAQRQDKSTWTEADLRARMSRGLEECIASGCGTIRTHIDWGSDAAQAPHAWEIARALRDTAAPRGVTLQLAALTGIDEMADPNAAEAVARRVARDGGVFGAFVLAHKNIRAGLENMFTLAERFGLALDFHADEALDPTLTGLDMIIDVAREQKFAGPVLCGHACTLATRSDDAVARLADGLAETGIAIVTLPTTNLFLQGRTGGTPKQRGLTMLHEVQASGVDVVIGTDNVRDAFCPIGTHDPLNSLGVAILAGHLDPPLETHLPMITTTARRALGLPALMIDDAPLDDLLLFEASDITSLISDRPRPTPLCNALNGEIAHG